jgi:L-asparaginase
MSDARDVPWVAFFALGGTIASVKAPGQEGAKPVLSPTELLGLAGELPSGTRIEPVQFLQVPSTEISLQDLHRLSAAIHTAVASGAKGVVVAQGTDTLEETAFVLDILCAVHVPIVVTGAMRTSSAPGSDGPANLQAAFRVALHERACNCGVLVVLNEEIHAARFTCKTHSSNPSAFKSPGLGPLGWISEGRPFVALRPIDRPSLSLPTEPSFPPVALLRIGLGDDGRLLSTVSDGGFKGLVIEALGGGHLPTCFRPMLRECVKTMPVVLASRTGAGEVLKQTYSFQGSEMDLISLGLIRSGHLNGLKSRMVLSLCLAAGIGQAGVQAYFETYAG